MFTDRLKLSLTLTIGKDAFTIPGGAVRELSVDAQPWGYEASTTFLVSSEQEEDKVFPRFITKDLARATLAMRRVRDDGPDETLVFTVTGYVTAKRVSEVIGESMQGLPVVLRRYTVWFKDVARAFWTQHHPIELYVDTSPGEVLQAHTVQGMTLTGDWVKLLEKQDVLCLGLRGDGGPSFYDFVAWWVDRNDGVFEYDVAADAYRIADTKTTRSQAIALDPEDVLDLRMQIAEPRRHATHVLNASIDAAVADKEIANVDAASGVRRDVLAHTPLASRFDAKVLVETARVRPGEHGLAVTFKRFPPQLPAPGDAVSLGDGWSTALYASGATYRAHHVEVRGKTPEGAGDDDLEDESCVFELDVTVRAELASDPVVRLPPFRCPDYPVVVEGKVVSASGEDLDRTWFSASNEATSAFEYRVDIPLYNKKVVAPFTPNQLTGHFFFPAYKNQRVLVGLDFDRATILGYLDWAANAKLARETQGNAIAFGYNADNGTQLRHQYEEEKPSLRIQRRLGGDQQTVEMSEGRIFFEVKEDPLVPEVTPKFDVSAQVESAKAELAGKVTASVSLVTGKFAASSGATRAKLDGTTAEVGTALGTASKTLDTKIGAVESELAAAGAVVATAIAAVAAAVAEAKASIVAAGPAGLKASLAALVAELEALVADLSSKAGALDARIATLDAPFLAAFDDLAGEVTRLQAQVEARMASLEAAARAIGAKDPGTVALAGDAAALEARLTSLLGEGRQP